MVGTPDHGEIVFIGDSHIEQYYPRVKLLSANASARPSSAFITSGGCPPLPGVNMISPGYACDTFLDFALQYARRPAVRTVVFGAYWEAYVGHRSTPPRHAPTTGLIYRSRDAKRDPLNVGMASTETVFQDFTKSVRTLTAAGKNVFVLLSNPSAPVFDPAGMISRLSARIVPRNLDRSEFVEGARPVVDRVRQAAEAGGATVIDPVTYLCGPSACQTTRPDGEPLYRDDSHLRASSAEAAVFVDLVFGPAEVLSKKN
jgi:hypothetical protein